MTNETNQNPQAPQAPQQTQTPVQETQAQNQALETPQSQEQTAGNAPIDTLRDGALKVSIFKNERENGTNFALDQGRIYTDAQGQIQEAKTLSGTEPLRMARLLEKGYDRIGEFKAELKQAQQSEREK